MTVPPAFMVGWDLFDRRDPERPGIGCMVAAVIVDYFASLGVIGDQVLLSTGEFSQHLAGDNVDARAIRLPFRSSHWKDVSS